MASVKWGASLTDRGTVLTTELNTLGNDAFTAVGSEIDNGVNLDRWGWLQFLCGSSITPTTGAVILIYMVTAPDATNYGAAPSSTNVGTSALVAVIPLPTAAGTHRVTSSFPFALPPCKVKFVLKNESNVTLPGSGNVVRLFTGNEAVV